MSDEQIEQHFRDIKRQLAALRGENPSVWEDIDAALEDLRAICEQMQASLEAVEVTQEELFQQKQYYQNIFQFFPIASLITNSNGLILEANQAIAQLLNVSHRSLIGKLLATFVAEGDAASETLESNRAAFQNRLQQWGQSTGVQVWQTRLCPPQGQPVPVELHVAIVRNPIGQIEHLKIGVYCLSQGYPMIPPSPSQDSLERAANPGNLPVPHPALLNGLRVLVVDDEADAREFVLAVLGSHGIHAKAVASAAEALEELKRFHPDVLLSDIRMPGEDGYSLIRQVRALEAEQGGHLPAAAVTAYLQEDLEKAIEAGFEAHLHKFAQPIDWVVMVAELAKQPFGS